MSDSGARYSRSFPTSTLLVSADYDPYAHALEVRFRNGSSYRYRGVPERVWTDLLEAASAGEYFVANIRNRFASVKEAGQEGGT